MISLCMIVKNEENRIEKCLRSVKDYVNEMIIVDTGSTDQTKEICKRLGATVVEFNWNNDFSAARNFGLKHCKSRWIFTLDADEEVDRKTARKLPKLVSETNAKVIALPIINYYGTSTKVNKNDYYLLYQPRLFQNINGVTFENRIHEALKFPENLTMEDMEKANIPIHHYGYMHDVMTMKNKAERNLDILLQEISDPNHSPWIEYHIASELNHLKRYEIAFQFVNQAIMMFLKGKIAPPPLLYKLKYDILVATENWDGAWPGINKAIELYPDYVDLHYYKGVILFHLKNYQEALDSFNKCLELGDQNSDYLVLHGVGSFKAKEYYDLCLQRMNED